MKDSACISIVTPSYNQGKYIERTIQSVLSQDVDGLEYMVFDGGSTDETQSVLERYGEQFFWVSENDRGPSDAINKGFRRSSGPILGWLNSDDVYYPGALKAVVDFFEKNPDVDVVYGGSNYIDENDELLGAYPTEHWDWELFKDVCFISQPAAFFRRRIFNEFGPLAVGIRCMDYEFWLRLGKKNIHFAHIPQLLAATRLHKDAFTVAGRLTCQKEINSFTRQHLSKTPDQWLFGYAHAVADSMCPGLRRQFFFYRLSIMLFSIYAALRWNGSISKNMTRTLMQWTLNSLRLRCRRLLCGGA